MQVKRNLWFSGFWFSYPVLAGILISDAVAEEISKDFVFHTGYFSTSMKLRHHSIKRRKAEVRLRYSHCPFAMILRVIELGVPA
uniref:Putative secreted protein n=1 Tax=Ixodes ricinus TaxID=34613 RepID=A0A6B0TZW3_IXORI